MQRLFWKQALVGWQGPLHETAFVNGPIGILSARLVHNTHRTLEEMVAKTNEWSVTEAHLRYEIRHPTIVWWRILRVMGSGFWQSCVQQGSWRAGTYGVIEAMYQSWSMFVTYAKLWELQRVDETKQ